MKPSKIFKHWSRYSGLFMRSFCETLCFVGVFVVVLSLFGCESSFEDSSLGAGAEAEPVVIRNYQLNELLNAIPLASADEFNDFSDPYSYRDNGYLSCKVARDIGFAELMANLSLYYPSEIVSDLNINPVFFNWEENLSFSDVPVIVYGYDDLPYYYEFPLIFREETIVGTVTISARPYNDEIVAYVFPKPLQYINTTCKRYIGEYPNVYYEVGGNICYAKCVGDEVEFYPAEGELITNLSDALLSQIANIQDMDTLLLDLEEDAGYDEGDGYHSLEQYVSAFIPSEETASYWTDKSEEFAASPDEFFITPEIVDETITIAYQDNNTPSDPNTGFLVEYRNNNLRRTQWGDACGPAILSWLYRGKYDSYNGKYLPIHRDAVFAGFVGSDYPNYTDDTDSKDYAEYDMGDEVGEENDMATRERKSLATDGGLYYEFFQECLPAGRYWAMYDDDIRRSVPRVTNGEYIIKFTAQPIRRMEREQQPIVFEKYLHYFGAIGYAYKRRASGARYNKRLFVMDNGSYAEKHGNYPYWETPSGLNYAWERQ